MEKDDRPEAKSTKQKEAKKKGNFEEEAFSSQVDKVREKENVDKATQPTEEELKKLSQESFRHYLVRCALRVFPLIGYQGLEFWERGKRKKYLLTFESCLGVGLAIVSSPEKISLIISAMAADDAARYAAEGDVDAARAAAYAGYVDYDEAYYVDYFEASFAAATAAGAGSVAINAARIDFDLLVSNQEILQLPLWPEGLPDNWQKNVITPWRKQLNQIKVPEVGQRYQQILNGHPNPEKVYQPVIDRIRKLGEGNTDKDKDGDKEETPPKTSDSNEPKDTEENLDENGRTYNRGTQGSFIPESSDVEDRLGRSRLVNAIANFLSSSNSYGKLTIGLLGNWGAGKSTVLKLLKNKLTEDKQYDWSFASFNAWSYEHGTNTQAGIAQECVAGLTEGFGFWKKLYLLHFFSKRFSPVRHWFFYIILFLALISFAYAFATGWQSAWAKGTFFTFLSGALVLSVNMIQKVASHPLAEQFQTYMSLSFFGKELGTIPVMKKKVELLADICLNGIKESRSNKFKLPFSQASAKALDYFYPQKERRFLFVIDDLDRCSEEGIIKVFEAVRLVMTLDKVTVVIAVDQNVALPALACRYASLSEHHTNATPQQIARDYLGKIIQLPVVLTPPTNEELGVYIDAHLFSEHMHSDDDDQRDTEGSKNKKASDEDRSDKESSDKKEPEKKLDNETNKGTGDRTDIGKMSGQEEEAKTGKAQEGIKQYLTDEIETIDEIQTHSLKHSESEKSHFKECVKAFKLTNPRQIKRLFNSYRLFSVYHSRGKPLQHQAFELREREFYFPALTMMFLLEACADEQGKLNNSNEKQLQLGLFKQKENFDNSQLSDFDYSFIHPFIYPEYERLESLVFPFVLPGLINIGAIKKD